MTKQEINAKIQTLETTLKSSYTPESLKPKVQEKIKELKALLKETEAAEKPAPKPVEKTAKPAQKPNEKQPTRNEKQKIKTRNDKPETKLTRNKKRETKLESDIDALLAKIKANPKLKEHYKGTSKSSIKNDAQRQAMKPGKRTSASGEVYYENRANRTDIGKFLADGGGVDETFYKEGNSKYGLANTEIFIHDKEDSFDVYDNIYDEINGGNNITKLATFDTMDEAKEFAIEHSKTKFATGGSLTNGKSRYEKDDEGMYEGDLVRVLKFDGTHYHIAVLDDDGSITLFDPIKSVFRDKFEPAFAYFQRVKDDGTVNYASGGNLSKNQFVDKTIVYDNGGKTLDRYTVFTPDGSVYAMSENASGFNQYIGEKNEIPKGSHLGKKLSSVPKEIEWAVIDRMETYASGGSTTRANRSKALRYANFEDGSHINLLRLNKFRNNSGLQYKGGNEYAVSASSMTDGQKVLEFKTLNEAELKFEELVGEKTKHIGLRDTGSFQNNYALGGNIPNNYQGKSPAEVWDSWSVAQREHFISDHSHKVENKTETWRYVIAEVPNRKFDNIPYNIKKVVEDHVKTGQYALGGSFERGGSLTKKSFTLHDYNMLMEEDNGFRAYPTIGGWQITQKNSNKILGVFNEDNETIKAVGSKKIDNPLVKYLQLNTLTSHDEYWRLENGSTIPSHFGSGKNIKVFNYQTQNFDNCTPAATAFTTAQQHIEDEYKKADEKAFILYSNALENFAKKVDAILGIEKQIVLNTVANACHNTVDLLQECGVFNYKSGMQISFNEVTTFLMPHIATIQEFAALEEKIMFQGGGTKIVARGNTVMAVNIETNEVLRKVLLLHEDDSIENTAWFMAYQYNLVEHPIEPLNPQLELDLQNTKPSADLYKIGYFQLDENKILETELRLKEIFSSSEDNAEQQFIQLMLPKENNEDYVIEFVEKIMANGGDLSGNNYAIVYEKPNDEVAYTKEVYVNNEYEAEKVFYKEHPSCKITSIRKMFASGGGISDKFEVGTPAVYHSLDYRNNPKEETGEIVVEDGLKGILLYPNKNYSGSRRIFIVPNWNNVETFYESNERQEKDIPFVIKNNEMFATGGEIRQPKYDVGDVVSYENGDLEIEKWVGVITKVLDFDTEYAYRVDAYTTNLQSPMQDLSNTNEKYEVQLKRSPVSKFENAKKAYDERTFAKGGSIRKGWVETYYDNGKTQLLGSDGTLPIYGDVNKAIKEQHERLKRLTGIKPFLLENKIVLKAVNERGSILKQETIDLREMAKGGKVEKIVFTKEEDAKYDKLMSFYLNDGLSERKAEKETLAEMIVLFPRLKKPLENGAKIEANATIMATGGKVGGRGWEGATKGAKINNIKEFEVGKVYLTYSPQFNAKNLIKITSLDKTGLKRPIVYAEYVRNTGNDHEFAIWDFDLKDNEYYKSKEENYLAKGGEIDLSLIKKYSKENPYQHLPTLASVIIQEHLNKHTDLDGFENIDWENLSKEEHDKMKKKYYAEKRNLENHLINEYLKAYFSNEDIRKMCKGDSERASNSSKRIMRNQLATYKNSNKIATTFKQKQTAIAKTLEGKKVPRKYQKTAGKTYNRKEAMAAAAKIEGSILAKSKKK